MKTNRIEFNRSELLRFITAGSVDDGKSTLIGRLLHDSKSIFEDQLAAVERTTRRKYVIKHTTKTVKALISPIHYRVDVNTLRLIDGVSLLKMNDIARVGVKAQQPLVIDGYGRNRATGSFIIIDEATHNTVAAGMIV